MKVAIAITALVLVAAACGGGGHGGPPGPTNTALTATPMPTLPSISTPTATLGPTATPIPTTTARPAPTPTPRPPPTPIPTSRAQIPTVDAAESTEDAVLERDYEPVVVRDFAIAGHIPNAVFLDNEDIVDLIYVTREGFIEMEASDGVNFSSEEEPRQDLTMILDEVGLLAVGAIVRERKNDSRRYFLGGLPPPEQSERFVYSADPTSNGNLELKNNGDPIYLGGPSDKNHVGVIDITVAPDGQWRMFYVSVRSERGNTRTALSDDEGISWVFESDDPFKDLDAPKKAQTTNVDPAVLRLNDSTYLGVTMRGGQLFIWNSLDGLDFTQIPDRTIDASLFSEQVPGATGLFDPTIVQLPDDTIYLYVTAGGDPSAGDARIVAAQLVPLP